MSHLKRNKIEKFWPIPRKGTKYLAVATHNHLNSMPLCVVMRDVLKITKNKKELKKALNEKKILINNREIRETNYPVCLFDIITLKGLNKNYKATLSEIKKMFFKEVSRKETETKIYKIQGRKKLPGGKTQLNLMQGRNILSEIKVKVGDSVIINSEKNKVEGTIPLEKGKIGFTLKGKHAGSSGKIIDIIERGGKKIAKIEVEGKKINVWTRNIIVIK